MKGRTKRDLFFFALSMGSLVGGLFHPLYHHIAEMKQLEFLTITLQEKERDYAHLLESQRVHHLNAERVAVMEQDGFFEDLDENLLMEKLHALAQSNKIHVHHIQMSDPVKESVESSIVTQWPVEVEFSGNSEEDVYSVIESIQKNLPGLVVPTDLLIIQKKRHVFWVRYGFMVFQGTFFVGSHLSESGI